MTAKMKLNSTPPSIISSLCQAGFERNSQGFGSCRIESMSKDSSIIPLILQYPPIGSQPMPYSVSASFIFGKSLVNQPVVLVLKSFTPPASKKRKNLSTLVPQSLANMKCPAS